MLHWSQEASTGWTRNSWGASVTTRADVPLSRISGGDRSQGERNTGGCRAAGRLGIYQGKASRAGARMHATPAASTPRPSAVGPRGLRRAAVAATLARREHRSPARGRPRRDVSATEFAFLAFGLVLGVGAGIALAMVIRSRPSSRQVRLTIAPGSVAVRRPQTLSQVEQEDHSAAAIGTPTAERTSVRPGPGPRLDAPAPSSSPIDPGGATPTSPLA